MASSNKSDDLLLSNIQKLPAEIEKIIFAYIPAEVLMTLNKQNYYKYHYLMYKKIRGTRFQSFIRMTLRNDFSFLFRQYMRENIKTWNGGKYVYKNIVYPNYLHFLFNLALDNNSTRCKKEIERERSKIKDTTLKTHKNKNIQRIWTN